MKNQQQKVYTTMPLPAETIASTDLEEAVRVATNKAKETGAPYGIFVNLEPPFNEPAANSGEKRLQDFPSGLKSIAQLTAHINRLNQLVCRDPLTGLYNSRYLRQRLSTEFKRAKRDRQPLSCVMLDVDRFKMINDTYGHPAGDCALKSLGFFLRRKLRETDVIARYGGDEFCILLPNTFFEKALTVMNKVRRQTAEHLFRINGASIDAASINGTSINIGISFGLASIPDDDICQPAQLIDRADKSLYQAKNTHQTQAGAP